MIKQVTEKEIIAIAIIVMMHVIGFIGLTFTPFSELFVLLTPLNIIFTVVVIYAFDQQALIKKIVLAFLIVLAGWLIEWIGVKTGILFGEYRYTNALGPKLFEVPLVIGVNWLLMVVTTVMFVKQLVKPIWLVGLLAALLMVLVDVFIEPFAVHFQLWQWFTESGMPDVHNYLGWFLASLPLCYLFAYTYRQHTNKVAIWTLPILVLFFILNNLFN